MHGSEKLISVIIPVYNPGKYLYHCLDSVIHQTYKNLEIILVDDGSTDNSGAICDEYAAKDSRIVCVHQPNGGVSKARNKGMSMAHGDFFSFIDSDDYLERDSYEYLIQIAEREKPDIVCFEYFTTWNDHEVVHSFRDKSKYGTKDRKEAMKAQLTGVPFSCVKLFSKKIVSDLRFTEGLARGEDGEFARYAIHKAETVYYTERPLLHYVQSEESAVRGAFRINQLSILNTTEKSRHFYQQNYPELLPIWNRNFLHLTVSLYCDMYADAADLKEEKKRVFHEFCKTKKMVHISDLSLKERVKFSLFRCLPRLFAAAHTHYNK